MTPPLLTIAKGATVQRDTVGIDLIRLVAGRALVQGSSGSGKSALVRFLLEATHGQLPHLVVDPEGEFHTLRERFDYLLIRPDGGDLPLPTSTAGVKRLAHALAEMRASAIIDIYELELPAQREVISTLLRELLRTDRSLWYNRLLVVDELHVFAPEGGGPTTAAIGDVARRGRKRGIGLIGVTQSLAGVDKEVVRQLTNLFVGLTSLDIDVDRAAKRLGFRSKDQREQLSALDPGEFFVHGPAFLTGDRSKAVRLARAPWPTRTTHPQVGGELVPVTPPATGKVKSLAAQLAKLQEKAEPEADAIHDPLLPHDDGYVRLTVAAHNDLLDTLNALADAERTEAARADALEEQLRFANLHADGADARADALQERVTRTVTVIDHVTQQLQALAAGLTAGVPDAPVMHAPAMTIRDEVPPAKDLSQKLAAIRTAIPETAVRTKAPARLTHADSRANGELPPAQQRMLDTLGELLRMHVQSIPEPLVAVLSEQSPKSSSWREHRKALLDHALIERDGGTLRITDAGMKFVRPGALAFSVTLKSLHDRWRELLPDKQRMMFDVLLAEPNRALPLDRLAASSGQSPKSSSWRENLTTMKRFGLLRTSGGTASLTDLAFPRGLR